jgi:ApbE superfamily uncharacterized protein (UPF0280 family)
MIAAPVRLALAGGREHWQHGPIDLVIAAHGDPAAVARAYANAWRRFQSILGELVAELPLLRSPVWQALGVRGPVARRMVAATLAHAPEFITPMAAVAGSVAQEVVESFAAEPGVEKAYVNNGGDIALHLCAGQAFCIGVIANAYAPLLSAATVIDAAGPVRGIATSGWRGRSFSLGIADSVTVLARTGSAADAAATIIANAVNVEHPGIERAPANTLKDDTDLGARLVTVDVGMLPAALRSQALEHGMAVAQACLERGLVVGAALALQGDWRTMGCLREAQPAIEYMAA